jgi:hypothetical protein
MSEFEAFCDSFISEAKRISKGEVVGGEEEGRHPDFMENSFTESFLGYLDERGIADGAVTCHFAAKTKKGHVKLNAWVLDEDEGLLTLCITNYIEDGQNRKLTNTEIDQSLRQLIRAFEIAISGYYLEMEPSSEAYDLLKCLYEKRTSYVNIEFILLTNCLLPKDLKVPRKKEGAYSYQFDCWDLTRLHKVVGSELPYESITIEVEERFGHVMPCLSIQTNAIDHKVHLAVIPGRVLGELYEEFGHKLLDLNVRSFLQAKGKVNKGIRETLNTEPERFLAYNNGISATVEALDFCILDNGSRFIRSMTGFQVVNGGQTMASIHRSTKIDGTNVENVYVQAKITEVEPERIPDLAPLISRYANSQNKVSDADFSSNDPIHIELQRLSERIWAPGEQTRWFYERTRGQFQVERNRKAPTIAKAKKYDLEHPSGQRFTKTDMAKFMYSWDMYPQIVSLGAQKNFVHYMSDLRSDKGKDWRPDDFFFKELVAKAIIFKSADRVARLSKIPSYKANVVTYMVSFLSKKCLGRLNLLKIWEEQKVPASIIKAFEDWVEQIHEALVESANGRNVTEWCKKDECWDIVRELPLSLPSRLKTELENSQPSPTVGNTRINKRTTITSEGKENLARTMQLDDKMWFDIARWGRKTHKLEEWQCKIAVTLAGYALSNWSTVPSVKQAAQAVRMINAAIDGGMPGLDSRTD